MRLQELVNRVLNEQCADPKCEHWGKYTCEAECSNHMCAEHSERCLDCGERLCLGCYPLHKHCKACGAVGKLFYGLCGICHAVWSHEQQVIHSLTQEVD